MKEIEAVMLNYQHSGETLSPVAQMNYEMLLTRMNEYRYDFESEIVGSGRFIVDYKLVSGQSSVLPVDSIASPLHHFQRLFSGVADALVKGPKKRLRISDELKEKTSFRIETVYAGSFGAILSTPDQNLLIPDPLFEDTLDTVVRIAASRSSDDVFEISKMVGPALISEAFAWAHSHRQQRLEANIEYIRASGDRYSSYITTDDWGFLEMAIQETSDIEEEIVDYVGTLVGLHTKKRRFYFERENGENIHGLLGYDVMLQLPIEVPIDVTARVTVSRTRNYATEEEEIVYILESVSL